MSNIGKRIGDHLYVHRSCEDEIPHDALSKAKCKLPKGFDYDVVKFNLNTGQISLIESPDFDTSPEPVVGRSLVVKPYGHCHIVNPPKDPWIYHHKWMMVRDDYEGFNVREAKVRSALCMIVVKALGVPANRYGKKSVWEQEVVPFIHTEKL